MLSVDPRSGYCKRTKIFHSLRAKTTLPPQSIPLSITSYALSLTPNTTSTQPAIIIHNSKQNPNIISFPQLISAVRSLAHSLSRFIPKGSVALIVSPPSIHVPALQLALLAIGVVVSPINPLTSKSELQHIIELSKPVVAFASSEAACILPSDLRTFIIDSPKFYFEHISGNTDSLPSVEILQSDAATILYSSGTTGKAKGVLITHRNLIANVAVHFEAKKNATTVAGVDLGPTVSLFTVPLFHVFGFFMFIRCAALGDTMVLMERFVLGEMLKAVEKHRATAMPVSPPIVVAMVKSKEAETRDISSLRVIGSGGAPLGREVAERFKAKFPNIEIAQGYGLTETTGGVAGTQSPEEMMVFGSTGKLSSNVEAKIVDPDTGDAVGPGVRGELWVRGPTVMKGYVGDDKATAATLDPEGWLKTGDLCYMNEDGYLFIVDRIKELIKYKAYQVPPAELEHILQSHPEIEDVAVIPYPDEEAGEIPMAFVVRKTGSGIGEEQVMDFVAKQVAPYKKIRRVAFASSIPKSPSGKILRKDLVKHALSLPKSKL